MKRGQLRSCIAAWAFGVVLSGCIATQRQADELRHRSLQMGICQVHHIPLREDIFYGYTGSMIIDFTEDYHRLERKYPNALPTYLAHRKSPLFTTPERYRYCALCEAQLLAEAEKLGP